MVKTFLLKSIRFYQRYLSFDTGIMRYLFPTGPSTGSGRASLACRFSPTCSEYMYQAIARYGIFRGFVLGFGRIIRCHPWNKGGHDPVR